MADAPARSRDQVPFAALKLDLYELAEHPTLYGQEEHGETHAEALEALTALERAVERRNRGIREYQRRMRAALRVIDGRGLVAAYLLAYRDEPDRNARSKA